MPLPCVLHCGRPECRSRLARWVSCPCRSAPGLPLRCRPKIVQGRVDKIAKTMALLEQPFVKDSGKTVAEVVKEAVAAIGENIQIRRFAK